MKDIASGRSASTTALTAAALAGKVLIAGSSHDVCDRHERGLQLAGEAHHVDQRRAQVVADDVGEPLNFLVGALQVRGPFADTPLKATVQRINLDAGLPELARI